LGRGLGGKQCKTKYRRKKSAARNKQSETEYENIETDKISERKTEETRNSDELGDMTLSTVCECVCKCVDAHLKIKLRSTSFEAQ
jgi:hypothetical protein